MGSFEGHKTCQIPVQSVNAILRLFSGVPSFRLTPSTVAERSPGIGFGQQSVEMVHPMFAEARSLRIDEIRPSIEPRAVHATLHTLDDVDVSQLLYRPPIRVQTSSQAQTYSTK
jgi:hypothetical protein